MEEFFEVIACAFGVAAVAVFDPLGANEETAHLLIVASHREVSDQIDEFVGVSVPAVPRDGGDIVGGPFAREPIGEGSLDESVMGYIVVVGQIVDECG